MNESNVLNEWNKINCPWNCIKSESGKRNTLKLFRHNPLKHHSTLENWWKITTIQSKYKIFWATCVLHLAVRQGWTCVM